MFYLDTCVSLGCVDDALILEAKSWPLPVPLSCWWPGLSSGLTLGSSWHESPRTPPPPGVNLVSLRRDYRQIEQKLTGRVTASFTTQSQLVNLVVWTSRQTTNGLAP